MAKTLSTSKRVMDSLNHHLLITKICCFDTEAIHLYVAKGINAKCHTKTKCIMVYFIMYNIAWKHRTSIAHHYIVNYHLIMNIIFDDEDG